eukprot:GHRR01027686.1.p1 GENE.GHRR01027686.1~~GHRR01027686.1.p1  ORF type:complete len:173 (-),score=39.46 GHRR01027686.1:218-736(-)
MSLLCQLLYAYASSGEHTAACRPNAGCWHCRAKARYPHVQFEQIDGFDIRRLTALSPTGTYSKIFIDIGGIAQLHVVMSLVGLYYKAFKGSVLIVKNKYFKNLLGNVQVYVPQGELMHGNHSAVGQQNGAQAVCQPSNKNSAQQCEQLKKATGDVQQHAAVEHSSQSQGQET